MNMEHAIISRSFDLSLVDSQRRAEAVADRLNGENAYAFPSEFGGVSFTVELSRSDVHSGYVIRYPETHSDQRISRRQFITLIRSARCEVELF